MLRLVINIFVVTIGVVIVFTFLPASTKEKALALLSVLIPDFAETAIQEKLEPIIDPIIHTPAERREKLITKLENNLSEIKNKISEQKKDAPAAEEILQQIEETEKIIEKIKDANEEQGAINKITTSIVKKATEILTPEEKQPEPPYKIQPTAPAPSCRWVCD